VKKGDAVITTDKKHIPLWVEEVRCTEWMMEQVKKLPAVAYVQQKAGPDEDGVILYLVGFREEKNESQSSVPKKAK